MLKYIETRSEDVINNNAPKILNKTIKEYSLALVWLETLL